MIALDLDKCYNCKKCMDVEPGIYTLIERGIRVVVCRHCQNPPCVAACPKEALEKIKDGDLVRYKMKCVSCKQCASACPVGANPFEILNYKAFYTEKIDVTKCIKICDNNAISEEEKVPEGWIVIAQEFAVKALDWK